MKDGLNNPKIVILALVLPFALCMGALGLLYLAQSGFFTAFAPLFELGGVGAIVAIVVVVILFFPWPDRD